MGGRVREVVKAEWFRADEEPDSQLRCPLVPRQPFAHPDGPWYLAVAIVPWFCFAAPHPRKSDRMVVLARHWHILKRNFPQYFRC